MAVRGNNLTQRRKGAEVVRTVRLGDVCDVLDSKRKPITKKDRVKGEIPYYGATGIVDYVSGYIFDERLVLLGEDGAKWGAGEPSAFIIEGKSWVNNHAHVLRVHHCLFDEYLVGYLNYADLTLAITGVTVPKLNQQRMCEIPIPLPPLPAQRRIAGELDKICELKKNAETRLEKLDLLVKSRFVEMFGDIETGSQKFPVRYLEDVCLSMSAGKDVPEDSVKEKDEEHTVPIYSNGIEANGLYGYAREARITAPSITISGRGTIGFVCRREVPFVPIIRLVVATPDLNIVNLVYLESALRGRCAKNTGTTIPQLPVPVAKRIQIMVPPLAIQREFAALVEKIDKLKDVAKQCVEQMDTLYRAKLQECFG